MKTISINGVITSDDDKWIYDWLDMKATAPTDVREALSEADGDDVTLEINSPGGVVVAGTEIYQIIKDYKGSVEAHIVTACSAATIIACAADLVLMSRVGMYMIHNTQSAARGDYRDMDKESAILKEFNAAIINAYAEKTKKSAQELQEMMDYETWMSAEKAIKHGFADGYIDDMGADEDPLNIAAGVVIPHEKVMELAQMIKNQASMQPNEQLPGNGAGTDIQQRRDNMSLEEFLEQNPDAKAEYDAAIKSASDAASAAENARLASIDAVANVVTAETLHDAKYGEERIDGKELAYRAAVAGQLKAEAYMRDAISDAAESGANEVGAGEPDVGEEVNDAAEDMARHVNGKKEGN